MKEEQMIVEGMNCDHCVAKIQRFVGELKGVHAVSVDLKEKSVKVTCEETMNVEDIKEAILDAGFDVA